MKERLKINNFGPIKEACIEVNKYTIFIGESSSGKSIIMKILAFCKWLQKRALINYYSKDFVEVNDSYDFEIQYLSNMGRLNESGLNEFLQENTKINFDGEFFSITITKNEIKINIKDKNIEYKEKYKYIEKIFFISDDRFIIPAFMQGAQVDGKIPYYTRNMYRDFINSHELVPNFTSKILNYEKITKKDSDNISKIYIRKQTSENEVSYFNASSGIKSVSVIENILESFDYLIDFVFNSFFKIGLKAAPIIKDKVVDLSNMIFSFNSKRSVFLEEPELSLFPKHQFELMKCLIEQANKKNDLNYVFSTHSPYIISALNNLIKASEIIKKFPEKTDKVREIIKTNALINIDEINAYLVKDGYVNNIIDNEFGIITADSIDDVGECLSLMYEDLLEILHEDF